ncbi:hypothetical protein [Paenibacillus humicus]|uniref:hypothetical protein n=1 Tax=Paenibacillus humicus TaxID=412861 RepID=UPI000FDA6ACB|nr:hypothetical protein [Paenibacillus humicus]
MIVPFVCGSTGFLPNSPAASKSDLYFPIPIGFHGVEQPGQWCRRMSQIRNIPGVRAYCIPLPAGVRYSHEEIVIYFTTYCGGLAHPNHAGRTYPAEASLTPARGSKAAALSGSM